MSDQKGKTGSIKCEKCNYEFGAEGVEIRISEPIYHVPVRGQINNNVLTTESPAQGKVQCPCCGYAWVIHSGHSSFYEI